MRTGRASLEARSGSQKVFGASCAAAAPQKSSAAQNDRKRNERAFLMGEESLRSVFLESVGARSLELEREVQVLRLLRADRHLLDLALRALVPDVDLVLAGRQVLQLVHPVLRGHAIVVVREH